MTSEVLHFDTVSAENAHTASNLIHIVSKTFELKILKKSKYLFTKKRIAYYGK